MEASLQARWVPYRHREDREPAAVKPLPGPTGSEGKVVEHGYAALNNHVVDAMFDLAVTDFETWSEEVKGREALKKSWTKAFEQQPGDQRKMTEDLGIKFFSSDVAVHKHRMENTGRVDEDGKPLPPREFLEALVLVKKEGKWLMAANYWTITKE